MAAVISSRPAPLHQKMKRPPPPALQTSVNAARSSQSSPSPSLSSKRPPSGYKHPPSASSLNGVNGSANGTGPRISNRRRESQKPGDNTGRQPRSARISSDGLHIERRSTKKMPEPYVKTTPHILKKFRKAPPSLIVHLHPTHFRFDQQDGSFSYNSPMKIILEHIKSQTVPHDMLAEILHSGVKFYDGCLIVEIQDHRTASANSETSSNPLARDKNTPFSVHNYNQHLTPSPFVPYPHVAASEGDEVSTDAQPTEKANSTSTLDPEMEKENQPTEEQASQATQRQPLKGPKVFTTVLFSTPLSLQEEVLMYANTPDPRSNNRKQSQINGRTPSSATMPHPPTPLSAVPPTPSLSGPPAKKQKMMVSGKDIPTFEAKLIAATASPLFLEPVDNLQEAQRVLHMIQDPLFQNDPPPPKTRKRTVAELAADEALAAEEQRFMLIMDERLAPSSSAAATANDGEAGAASFEPRFERFKTLEDIKISLQEKARREQEAKAQAVMLQQAAKAKQEQQERENRQAAQEHKARETRKAEQMRAYAAQMQQQNLASLQQQQASALSQHSHPPTSGGVMPNAQQLQASQAHHSSPVVHNLTPHSNSSPVTGNMMVSHPGQSVSMNVTSSGQGAGSPPRPGSTIPHAHPGVAATVGNQRSQRPPSRNGTPQMVNGTPRIQQNTPVLRNVTPTPRLSHASPAMSAMAHTPVMGHNMMATPQMGGQQQLTPQQQHQLLLHRQQQAYNQNPQMQGSPPTNQMSPQNLQQFATAQAHANRQNQHQQDVYQQQLHAQMQRQMASQQQSGSPQMMPVAPHQQQQMPQQPHPQQQPQHPQQQQQQQQQQVQNRLQQMFTKCLNGYFQRSMVQLQQQYGAGNIPPELVQQARASAQHHAKQYVSNQRNVVIQQQQQHQQQQQQQAQLQQAQQQQQQQGRQQQQQQQAANQAMMGMMGGGMGGGGMNGMH
ncbi:Transcription factor spt20 [Lignoscripta atroalba]|nr:Transcription factor spt20 [Lignoscripta atroalba]